MPIINRPLDLDWLDDFVMLAETGNFSRAAHARATAQPAFSRHIRALEDWVGVDLIDRGSHPVELTPAGKKFLEQLQPVLAGLEAARIKARAAHDLSAASLRFACTHALSLTFFPSWLATLDSRLRLGPIQTMSDHWQACEDLMRQRRVQFLLCYGHPDVPSRLDDGAYPRVQLGRDALIPVCAPGADGQPLYRADSQDLLPLLAYSEQSALGQVLQHARRTAPVGHTSVVFTAANAFLLKSLALSGRGLAWLPRALIEHELADGTLRIAADPVTPIPIEIRLYRQAAEMTPTAEALWRLVAPTSA